jgi:S1-C subfamily serine protease
MLAVNDKPVLNYWRLRGIVQSYPEKSPVRFLIQRAGKEYLIKTNLTRMPLPPAPDYIAKLGVKLEPSRAGDGLRVLQVDAGSVAEKTGLLPDDVILKIGGKQPALNWQETLLPRRAGEQVSLEIRRSTPTGHLQHTLIMVMR